MINLSFYYVFDLQDVEKELELQISMKQEMEMALRILEKDIHEKQDTMISLRQQLEEIKGINLEMYQKLQVGPAVFIHGPAVSIHCPAVSIHGPAMFIHGCLSDLNNICAI